VKKISTSEGCKVDW